MQESNVTFNNDIDAEVERKHVEYLGYQDEKSISNILFK